MTFWFVQVEAAVILTPDMAVLADNLEAGTTNNLVYKVRMTGLLTSPNTISNFRIVNPVTFGSPWDAKESEDIALNSVVLKHDAGGNFATAVTVATLSREGASEPGSRAWSSVIPSWSISNGEYLFVALDVASPPLSVRALQLQMTGATEITFDTPGDDGPGAAVTVSSGKLQFIRSDYPVDNIVAGSTNAGLQLVSPGEATVQIMDLVLNSPDPNVAGAEGQTIVFTVRDGAENPIAADSVLASIVVADDSDTYAVVTNITAASAFDRLTVSLTDLISAGVYIASQDAVTLHVSVNIHTSPAVSNFYVKVQDATDVFVFDEWTGNSATVQSTGFPHVGSTMLVKSVATDVEVKLDNSGSPVNVFRGESDVLLAQYIFSHPAAAPIDVGDIEITEVFVEIADESGNRIIPSDVLTRVQFQSDDLVIYGTKSGAAIENTLNEIKMLLFTNFVRVLRGGPVTVELRGDIRPDSPKDMFQVRICPCPGPAGTTTKILAQPAGQVSSVTVNARPAETFPRNSNIFTIKNSLQVNHVKMLPSQVFGGQKDVDVMQIILTNPYAAAGDLQIKSLTLGTDDGGGSSLNTSGIFSGVRLARGSTQTMTGLVVTLTPQSPIVVAAGAPVTLQIRADIADPLGATQARMLLSTGADVEVEHVATPSQVVGVMPALGASFPMKSGTATMEEGDLNAISNFPNPFAAGRDTTQISFFLREAATLTAVIYTPSGDKVLTLADAAPFTEGAHNFIWDGRNGRSEVIRNGVYLVFIRAESASGTQEVIRKIAVVK